MVEELVGGVGSGLGWGLGMGLALGVTSVISGGMRPVVKGAIRGGLWARDRITGVAAEASERVQDLYEEVQVERNNAGGGAPRGRTGSRRGTPTPKIVDGPSHT